MNFHRHWFCLRAERRGGRLAFSVDRFFRDPNDPRSNEFVYEDQDPLPCGRLAIWTYDNALAISRVRIAGESSAIENPLSTPPTMKFLIPESAPKTR